MSIAVSQMLSVDPSDEQRGAQQRWIDGSQRCFKNLARDEPRWVRFVMVIFLECAD